MSINTLHKGDGGGGGGDDDDDDDDDNNNNNNNKRFIQKETEKILKYKDHLIEIEGTLEPESKRETANNRGDWNHFRYSSDST